LISIKWTAQILGGWSDVASQWACLGHVNFQSRYEFLSSQETIEIDAWLDRILINEDDFKTG